MTPLITLLTVTDCARTRMDAEESLLFYFMLDIMTYVRIYERHPLFPAPPRARASALPPPLRPSLGFPIKSRRGELWACPEVSRLVHKKKITGFVGVQCNPLFSSAKKNTTTVRSFHHSEERDKLVR